MNDTWRSIVALVSVTVALIFVIDLLKTKRYELACSRGEITYTIPLEKINGSKGTVTIWKWGTVTVAKGGTSAAGSTVLEAIDNLEWSGLPWRAK